MDNNRIYVEWGSRCGFISLFHAEVYNEMLHYPQQITLHSNLYSVYEGQPLSLKIAYGNEFPILDYDYSVFEYDEYMEADAEDLPKVHFILYSDETVHHVHLFSISMRSWDDATGEVIYDATLENIQYQVDPEHPLSVGAVIWGDMPNLAVGFEDLEKNRRGHTFEDTQKAAQLIKEAGFSLGLQMMTGMPGSTKEDDILTAARFAALKPDTMRIYPTLVLKNTLLAKWFENGEYMTVKKNIKTRDFLQKLAGFYKIYPNTIKIDVTECKSVEESTKKVMEHIKLPELEV